MNEYEIAFTIGGCLAVLWIVAYILCWVGQWAWAWIDDSEAGKRSLFIKLFDKTKAVPYSEWKYPVYNKGPKELAKAVDDGTVKSFDIFGYAKDAKLENTSVHKIEEGIDYIYDSSLRRKQDKSPDSHAPIALLISALTPIGSVLIFKVYPIALSVAVLCAVAYLARFTRRNKKMFDEHTKDKNAHA